MDVCVVIPVYNEEAIIETVIDSWVRSVSKCTKSFQIIAINDGSRDKSGQILDQLARRYSSLTVVHQKNAGHGAAVMHGYAEALRQEPQWVFQVDSDNQFVADDFDLLWKERNRSDFILGVRKDRGDEPHRLVISRMMRLLVLAIFQVRPRDPNIPFRLIKTTLLREMLTHIPAETFAPNIFGSILACHWGYDPLNILVTHLRRKTGIVSLPGKRLMRACVTCAKQLFQFRSRFPIRRTPITEQSISQRKVC